MIPNIRYSHDDHTFTLTNREINMQIVFIACKLVAIGNLSANLLNIFRKKSYLNFTSNLDDKKFVKYIRDIHMYTYTHA